MEAAGGRCLPCTVDIRDENQVQAAVDKAVETFGGIDILINASAPAAIGNMDTPAVSSRLVHMRLFYMYNTKYNLAVVHVSRYVWIKHNMTSNENLAYCS